MEVILCKLEFFILESLHYVGNLGVFLNRKQKHANMKYLQTKMLFLERKKADSAHKTWRFGERGYNVPLMSMGAGIFLLAEEQIFSHK